VFVGERGINRQTKDREAVRQTNRQFLDRETERETESEIEIQRARVR
jgi:hypothetical protein